jgi:hypothetical protein
MLERQQQPVPDAVPALARYVVRSPLECATSSFERTGSTVMASLAVPPVRLTNTPEIPFKFVRHKLHLLIILLPEAFLARNCLILLLLHLELRLHSSFPSCFPLKKLLLACNPLGVARIRRLMSWTMILSLTFRTGCPSHFGNCLSQAYLLKRTLRFWPKTVWSYPKAIYLSLKLLPLFEPFLHMIVVRAYLDVHLPGCFCPSLGRHSYYGFP